MWKCFWVKLIWEQLQNRNKNSHQLFQKFWSGSTFPQAIWTSPARSPKGSPPSHWEGNKTAPGTYSVLVAAAPHWHTETRSLVSKRDPATPGNLVYPRGKPTPTFTPTYSQPFSLHRYIISSLLSSYLPFWSKRPFKWCICASYCSLDMSNFFYLLQCPC